MAARDPVADLKRIAFLLERANEATVPRAGVPHGRSALAKLSDTEIAERAAAGTLAKLPGVGDVTPAAWQSRWRRGAGLPAPAARHRGQRPSTRPPWRCDGAARRLPQPLGLVRRRVADRGDGVAAMELGHEYLVLTDHSPRLTVARGLTAERLREQLDVVAAINETLDTTGTPFRILTGIEVDILADGSLDQDDELLERLDVVVASVHSGLKDPGDAMTRRMLAAIANPHMDILGHCTGRKLSAGGESGTARAPARDRAHRGGRGRPESDFDAAAVFAACVEHDKAVEINCGRTGWTRRSGC
jgi:putative hydrolase